MKTCVQAQWDAEIPALAGKIVSGDESPGLSKLLPMFCPDEEYQALSYYVDDVEWTVSDFHNVAFMFACFTLLLEGDDNF